MKPAGPESSGRLHSLDNLRAIMMWLGIVLHAAINHITVPTAAVPWRDRVMSPAADLIFVFIHSFRMPVFFIVAGFFVALLVQGRGYQGMLKHRLRRLALPFAVFWPVLYIATGMLMMVFMHLMTHGVLGFNSDLMPPVSAARPRVNTMHLWFIWYLLWFCLLTALLCKFGAYIPDRLKSAVDRIFASLIGNWWGFIGLSLPLAAIGAQYYSGLTAPSGGFIPRVSELVHNGLYFLCGWYLYRRQDKLLALYAGNWWKYAAGGGLFFLVALGLLGQFAKAPAAIPHIEAAIAFFYGCASWLWSFALIGLFVRYLNKQNAVLKYVSESSYWVYLVHMMGTIGFGTLLYNLPAPALIKMLINIALTTAVCLATYQLLVRNTPVGVLLNGRRVAATANRAAAPA